MAVRNAESISGRVLPKAKSKPGRLVMELLADHAERSARANKPTS